MLTQRFLFSSFTIRYIYLFNPSASKLLTLHIVKQLLINVTTTSKLVLDTSSPVLLIYYPKTVKSFCNAKSITTRFFFLCCFQVKTVKVIFLFSNINSISDVYNGKKYLRFMIIHNKEINIFFPFPLFEVKICSSLDPLWIRWSYLLHWEYMNPVVMTRLPVLATLFSKYRLCFNNFN